MTVIRVYDSVSRKIRVSVGLKNYEMEQIVGQVFGSCDE